MNTINNQIIQDNNLVYRTASGDYGFEDKGGVFASCARFFRQLFHMRDYRLEHLLNHLHHEKNSTKITSKNIQILKSKLLKSYKIDPTILKIEKLMGKGALPGVLSGAKKEAVDAKIAAAAESAKDLKGLQKLSKKLGKAHPCAKMVNHLYERIEIASRWMALGLDKKLLSSDFEGCRFLIRTRLIYSIVGFQNSTAAGQEKHQIQADLHGRVLIKKQGEYVPVAKIENEMVMDKERQELQTKSNPKERWNYFSPHGLVPVDRWEHPEFIHIEELSTDEMKKLVDHSMSFYKGKLPPDHKDKKAVIQIVTKPRKVTKADENFFLTRYSAAFPVHAALRIITADGKVYSTGFGSTIEEDEYNKGATRYLSTINGMPTILDYDEFRPHDGTISTSVPVTQEDAEDTIQKLQEYRTKTIRFNILRQNCTKLTTQVLQDVGIKVNNETQLTSAIGAMLPSLKALPGVSGKLIRKISQLNAKTITNMPSWMRSMFLTSRKVAFFVPNMILKAVLAITLLIYGGSKGSPLPKGKRQDGPAQENAEELLTFTSLIKHPGLIFRDKTYHFYHSLPLIQWQMQQGSTSMHLYSKKPRLDLMPQEQTDAHARKRDLFVKKYLTNFGIS